VTAIHHPECILDPRLAAIPTIAHGFFTRQGGVSEGVYASLNCGIGSGDDRERVLTNRARVAATIGIAASHLVSPYQVHGANVAIVEEPWAPGAGPEADGLVTSRIGIAIGIGTADCAPVLFADPEAGVIGAAHAGWGGAFKGILEATVDAMVGLGAHRGRISAAIGPAIAQQSYEVGPEFRERFHADDLANDSLFRPSGPAHFRFDLVGYVTARLEKIGLGAISSMADLDTYADEARFFSFRRTTHRGETDYGRMISTIALT
jgi:YfiH family protein